MNLEAHNPDPVMVEIGLAIELGEEVMVTLEGNITDAPTISWGRETKYLLTRPKLLFFVTREQVDCVYRSAIWCSWCSWCSHMAGWRLIEAEWSQQARINGLKARNTSKKHTHMRLGSVNFECHDIVGLVHYSWIKSFACQEANRKATAAWGWNQLTYNLLDCPELRKEKVMTPSNKHWSFASYRDNTLQILWFLTSKLGYQVQWWTKLWIIN